ncbi:uncharacterized protein LOC131881956 [Tigriopus californicus]|uniref:uncharacterized protein LOC131881956 n=1 Tax=Tigriopus californicus TaxID=6832 RepID=UPI0027D9F195|nr:uncharacterized protein LOC131881956 [Tigriopus californicus]
MAGIVAQITKANWERKKRQTKYLPPDKSVYFIPAYEDRFQPDKHNYYYRRKAVYEMNHQEEEMQQELQEMLQELSAVAEKARSANIPLRHHVGRAFLGVTALSIPIGLFLFLLLTFLNLPNVEKI